MIQSGTRYRLPGVSDGKLEVSPFTDGPDVDGLIRRTVGKCVAQKIGEKLGDARPVAFDRLDELKFGVNNAVRLACLKLGNYLPQHGLQGLVGIAAHGQA